MADSLNVLIVGAGVAGLTLACAMAADGHQVQVVDIRPNWAITGWGLSLTGPALRALQRIDVAKKCVEQGYGITQLSTWSPTGELEKTFEPPRIAGQELPAQAGILRPVLHRILLERAAHLGIEPQLATTIDALTQDETQVHVRLNTQKTASYDLVVGADGVGSKVRQLLGIELPAHYLGQVGWRALVKRPEWVQGLHTYSAQGQTAGLIPISQEHAYAWIMEATADYRLPADVDLAVLMRKLLAPFGGGLAEVRDTITDPNAIVRRQIEVLLLDKPWHRGRVVLIGDAVHSPSPQMVSGAAMAIEDGVVLAEELRQVPLAKALESFSTRREPRCRMLHEACVEISRLQCTGGHSQWPMVQAKAFQALAAPA